MAKAKKTSSAVETEALKQAPNELREVVTGQGGEDIEGSDKLGAFEDMPRPVSAPEILALMKGKEGADEKAILSEPEANRKVPIQARANGTKPSGKWNTIILIGLWFGLLLGVGAMLALIFVSVRDAQAGLMLLGCIGLLMSLGTIAYAMRGLPVHKRGSAQKGGDNDPDASLLSGSLGGIHTLTDLKLAEKVLDNDPNARLVARRDGVVVFANKKYQKLAEDAGVEGFSGLPPRIERLFAQQGAEAMKVFRLCRAARSGESASEDIYQVSSLMGGLHRRRFEVSVWPIENDDTHVTWALCEMPIDEEEHDVLATAYADYVRPVFALEKSGQIAWANAAMREKLGAERGSLHHIDDVVLGETGALVSDLWELVKEPYGAKIRRQHDAPVDGAFMSFRRGGSGEGFVCVELTLDDEVEEVEELSLSGDISEAPFGVAIIEGEFGKDAKILEANKSFTQVFGGTKKNTQFSKLFQSETVEELAREVKRKAGASAPQIIEARQGDGPTARVFALYIKPVSRRRGGYGTRRTLLFSVEITERKQMELDHGQDQKLKAIGNLAGEVAHDFNNFLQTILGNCELLLMNHPVGDPSYEQLVVIRENSQRLANLTKQLLAFSRKQTMKRTTLSLTELLRDFTKFLDRAVGDKVQLDLINGRGLKPVRVDQNQLEAAIMNLAVNARDAMGPNGGKLIIRTQHISVQEIIDGGFSDLSHQDHVLIEISDTGPGVPADIADKIFDPFFTTKEVGKGTGLGLSTVHGVIGQMGGGIYLDSEEGKGAIFRIYLPALEADDVSIEKEKEPKQVETADLTGVGRILVVEDEDSVRNFVVVALRGRGYEVIEACDGVDALELLEEHGADHFDLIISDVMMAEMDGPVFVLEAQKQYEKNFRVIFMSGYAEGAMRDQIDAIEDTGYLQKPFQAEALAAAVKDVIGGPPTK